MAVRFDEGAGHPVVLLHGFPGSGADWEPAATHLAESFRVVVVDLIGFGGSSRPRGFEELWVDAQAEALAAALGELGIEQTALVGHDYGGPVAWWGGARFVLLGGCGHFTPIERTDAVVTEIANLISGSFS